MAISEKSNSIDNLVAQIEGLTKTQRILICIVAFVLIVGAFFWLSYMPKWQDIKNLRAENNKLELELKKSKKNAARLPEVQKQFEMKRREYISVMKSLPEKEEISNLLTSISRSGQDSGLEFMLFQPGADVNRNFYAEIPVSMRVSGGYHNVATFFDKVAKLSRIVNVKDIQIVTAKDDLTTSCTAVTYKFLENQPQSNPKKKN
ncbi:MAG: type 4a pilus biogenesis protein PilO [Desulfobacterales bacterium]|jgi:type IV pilus assembly protein PilO